MIRVTTDEKRRLKSRAHHLKPVVYIGRHGMSDGVLDAVEKALVDHELVKVKFNDFKDEKARLLEEIAEKTGCATIGVIGNIAILYRPKEEKRTSVIPK